MHCDMPILTPLKSREILMTNTIHNANSSPDKASLDQQFQDLRDQIDQIDLTLLKLINERAGLAQKIGAIKHIMGDTQMYRPEREARILTKHMKNNMGPIPNEAVAKLFRELMSICLSLEKPLNIAFLGPVATFTEQAAIKHFGSAAKMHPHNAINEVFREVESGNADFGVIPVENSTEGMVNHTLDSFLNSNLHICGETEIRIHQNLISLETDLADIQTIYSHPQSLAQCRNWLDSNMPHANRIAVSSNAQAVKRARSESNSAAIAGTYAAEHYKMPVLNARIEDEPNNTTRFLVIGQKPIPQSGEDKTSILVSANDRPGLLLQLIEPLAKHGVTMTKLESRPAKKGLWGYVFFIDMLGHHDDANLKAALKEIEHECTLFRILGSYPVARI